MGNTKEVKQVVPMRLEEQVTRPVIPVARKGTSSLVVPAEESEDEGCLQPRRYWEIRETTNCPYLKNSLKRKFLFWKKELKASSFVLNVISEGYLLPLSREPNRFFAKNNQSSLKYKQSVSDAINKLLAEGLIEEVSAASYCCNPLTVADKGKLRLVLDLRHVNDCIIPKPFKYEDLKILAEMFQQGDFFVRFDLTSGYHHIDIHVDHQKYLGFHWEFPEKIRYFQFTVLPFGLSTASHVFTKVMRPLNTRWRGKGIKSIIYIDDGIAGQKDRLLAKKAGQIIAADLCHAGFLINQEKSDFEPKQRGRWLGINVDTEKMVLSVPHDKLKNLKKDIEYTLQSSSCTPKQLSRIAGQLSAMHLALGPIVRLFTRHTYASIEERVSWYQSIELTAEAREELIFWLDNIEQLNGCTFKPQPTTSRIVFTDASDHGYGGFTMSRLHQHICAGRFNHHEASQSSTHRELLAVKYMLQSYGKLIRKESLQIHMDNFSATRILSVGNTKKPLQSLAIDIFHHCIKNNIKIIPQWIPREQNEKADYYSKINDSDDWGIDLQSFCYVSEQFGPFDVDRFADNLNKKVQRFNSKYYCPGTSHVDAFTANWHGTNNWLCPPISLIGSVIRHMEMCEARGTLLLPMWDSAYYWPFIYPNGLHLAKYIKQILVINPYFIANSDSNLFNGFKSFNTMALKIEF